LGNILRKEARFLAQGHPERLRAARNALVQGGLLSCARRLVFLRKEARFLVQGHLELQGMLLCKEAHFLAQGGSFSCTRMASKRLRPASRAVVRTNFYSVINRYCKTPHSFEFQASLHYSIIHC
jgi:hypothetical protein